MRALPSVALVCLLTTMAAHAADGTTARPTWTPPTYGAAAPAHADVKSPFADGFAPRKLSPGARALTAVALTALQTTSFAHIDTVDTKGVFGPTPSGNPGRAGDRAFIGDTSMDQGIR
jgi:hypothetical protein